MSATKFYRRVCTACGIGFRTAHSGDHSCSFCTEQANEYDRAAIYQDDHLNTDKVIMEFRDHHHGENDGFSIKGHRV